MLYGCLPVTWESNQTLKHDFSDQTTHFPEVVRTELFGKLENVVLIRINQRANQFSKRTMHNFSGHKQDQENPFFQEPNRRDQKLMSISAGGSE